MKLRAGIGPSSFAQEDDTPLRWLEAAGIETVPNPFGRRLTEDETKAFVMDLDGLLAGLEPLNRNVLSAAPRLKAIARVGIGMTNVDAAAAAEFGIKVSNTPGAPVEAVAEMTLAALLALCRNLATTNAALHAGRWEKTIGRSLAGASVLLIGFGRIGRRVEQLLRAFGATCIVFDPCLADSSLPEGVTRAATLHEGLEQAEIVSLHASGTGEILDAEAFGAMRSGVLLLNSARGELVNEQAMLDALESGKVAAAWFDAFWEEPYSGPLTRFPQVLLTPHVATYTRQCRRQMETQAVRNLLRDLGLPAPP